jgi:acyl-CoA thioester hydrolase
VSLDFGALAPDGMFGPDGWHHLPVRVFYEDTDFTGVVYHAGYLRFFERGRSSHLRAAGVTHQALLARPDPAAFAVLRIEVDYLRPARVDDALVVRSGLIGLEGARIRFAQEVRRDGQVLCKARVVAVSLHPDGRARRPPPDLVGALAPYSLGPEAAG